MVTEEQCIALEKRLAELLNYKNICDPNAMHKDGDPRYIELWGEKDGRNYPLPNWTSDWRDCGPLMVEHGRYPAEDHEYDSVEVFYNQNSYILAPFSHHPTKDRAVMYAIVQAVIAKLEAGQSKEG